MKHHFSGKLIFILSPQDWAHNKLSKHHYASELSRNNKVIFVAPPNHGRKLAFVTRQIEENLVLLSYTLPVPRWLKFKLSSLYKFILKVCLTQILRKNFEHGDYCIDFGCYQQFDDVKFFPAGYKIFFPVDDFELLQQTKRGCDIVFTVSKNVQEKFSQGKAHFINHGLSYQFVMGLHQPLKISLTATNKKINVAYAGNLFIRFIDTKTLREIIGKFNDVNFHFYGSTDFNPRSIWEVEWNEFLRSSNNVFIHGSVSTAELVKGYADMDAFLLCYKPDYKDYHAENSHKVLEYLSTGKVLVTTHLSIYAKSPLMLMTEKDKNEDMVALFGEMLEHLKEYNSESNMRARVLFALDNTYEEQLKRIEAICNQCDSEDSFV